MSNIVTALYDTREEAARALQALRAELSLNHAGIYDPTDAGRQSLRALDLTAEERVACEGKLATGDYLLLAQPPSGQGPDRIIALLERVAAEPVGETRSRAASEATGTGGGATWPLAEERIPIVEEALRVGTRTVVRGGARVRTHVEDVPVVQDIALINEVVRVARRPEARRIDEQELADAGLLRDRLFEIAQYREEALVTKQVFVREEIVVHKSIERRIEQIRDTVRRTVVETEYLGDAASDGRGQP